MLPSEIKEDVNKTVEVVPERNNLLAAFKHTLKQKVILDFTKLNKLKGIDIDDCASV